jgi:hypothetical protein
MPRSFADDVRSFALSFEGAPMIDYEQRTYDQWLAQPQMIVSLFQRFFSTNLCSIKWGKYTYSGRKRVAR